jgi:DNA (cytosine-5)-methyltransferase 1
VCDRPRVSETNQHAHRPTLIDLYAGAGGLSLGMEQAGFDVVAAVEFDPVHAQTHRYNFSLTPVLCRDMTDVSADDLLSVASIGWSLHHPGEPFPGTVDALVGGPPCQGFSVGGLRRVGDERNDQLLRFVELVSALRPRVFCLENVAGLLEKRFEGIRTAAIESLRWAGYTLTGADRYLDAVDFGVPQSRKRVLILGTLDDTPVPRPSPVSGRVTVADALEGLPTLARYRRLLRSDEAALTEADKLTRSHILSQYARYLAGLETEAENLSHPRVWDPDLLTSSLRTVHTSATVQRFRSTSPGSVEGKSRLHRLAADGVSRTLRAGTGSEGGSHTSPRPIHPVKSRVITVREAARLHGYPDWFRFHATNWHGHRQVGNSVPPPLARAAGQALIAALDADVSKPTVLQRLGDVGWLRQRRSEALTSLPDALLTGADLASGEIGLAG